MGISSNSNGERLDLNAAGNNQPFIQFAQFNQSPVQFYCGPGSPSFNANAGSLYLDLFGGLWVRSASYNNNISWHQVWTPGRILAIPLPQNGVPYIQFGENGNFLTQPAVYSGNGAPGNNQGGALGSLWVDSTGHLYCYANNNNNVGWARII